MKALLSVQRDGLAAGRGCAGRGAKLPSWADFTVLLAAQGQGAAAVTPPLWEAFTRRRVPDQGPLCGRRNVCPAGRGERNVFTIHYFQRRGK